MPKVAAVQMESRLLDPGFNLGRVIGKIKRAAESGAEVVVFPECVLTGYNMTAEEAESIAERIPGPSTRRLIGVCGKAGVFAVVGLLEKDQLGRVYNSSVLVGPQGLLGRYRKTHLPLLGVDRFLAEGDGFTGPFDTPIGKLAMLICYDLRFPEPMRALALAGTQVVVLPTAWPQTATLYPEYMARTRADENRVYLVAANHIGEERGTRYLGRSLIIAPEGKVLAEADTEQEALLLAEVNPKRSDRKHLVFKPGEYELDLFGDRRPELYRELAGGLGP